MHIHTHKLLHIYIQTKSLSFSFSLFHTYKVAYINTRYTYILFMQSLKENVLCAKTDLFFVAFIYYEDGYIQCGKCGC